MNAAIGLCHFCESHGPCVVFCTQVFNHNNASEQQTLKETNCNACSSIGVNVSYTSRDKDNNFYISKQVPSTDETYLLLKHACVRSLSCEVSSNKENSLVFFGDTSRGHILSYSFQIKDTKARGLKRWFSFIILMKDKVFLLNITPFLSEQMKETSKELQNLADIVYAEDQALCSQRSLRLRNGKMESSAPRSLVELTDQKHIYAYLHTRFSWILSSGSRIFTEIISDGMLPKDQCGNNVDTCSKEDEMSLRKLAEYLGNDMFLRVVYCTLVGIQIIVRGDSEKCKLIVASLECLLPSISKITDYSDYVPESESRLFSCSSSVAVPRPCSGVCRLDIVNEIALIHWTRELPPKWPSLMINIIRGIRETSLRESVLKHHLTALKYEWTINAKTLKCALKSSGSQENLVPLKKSLGIKLEDEELLNYWMSHFVQ